MTSYSQSSLPGMVVAWSTCSQSTIHQADSSSGTPSTTGTYWKISTHTWMFHPIIPEHSQTLDTNNTTTSQRYACHMATPCGQDSRTPRRRVLALEYLRISASEKKRVQLAPRIASITL